MSEDGAAVMDERRDLVDRDAKVAEIVRGWTAGDDGLTDSEADTEAMWAIAALYPSPGDRDDSEECARCAALFASYGERFPEGSVVRCHTHRPISEEQR